MASPGAAPSLNIDSSRATVRLHRPALHNRLGPDDVIVLGRIVDELAGRGDLRSILFTAEGPTFCSGYDLAAMAEGGMGSTAPGSPAALIAVLDRIEALETPTLAAIGGSLYGGGLDLALACDFRLGVSPARAFIPISRIGALYPPTAIHRLVSRAGPAMAKRLLLVGATIDAEAMVRCGILDDVGPLETLAERTETWIAGLERQAPLAVRAAKRVIDDMARLGHDAAAARLVAEQLHHSADHAEGLAALAEKRPPRFTAR